MQGLILESMSPARAPDVGRLPRNRVVAEASRGAGNGALFPLRGTTGALPG